MNKVTKPEMITHLRDKKRLVLIDDIKKLEMGTFRVDTYISEDKSGYIVVVYVGNDTAYYSFDLTNDEQIKFFHGIVASDNRKEITFDTQIKETFENAEFINYFGKIEHNPSSDFYIAFAPHDTGEKHNIRQLTIDDEHHVAAFETVEKTHLRKFGYEKFLVEKSYMGVIYGYFLDDKMCSYIMADSIDDYFYHVGYIHTFTEFRGQGMGTALANYFLNETIKSGKIPAYGHADNIASANAARKAGFSPYDDGIWCATYKINEVQS